jgi:ribosomal protein S27AE
MAATASKMTCPRCGVEMNHHCDKLVYATDPQDMQKIDPGLGGLVQEFHSCPRCGSGASRPT